MSSQQPKGYQLLRMPILNKGLSFSREERNASCLDGLLPDKVESFALQNARALNMVRTRPTDMDKYLYLSLIKSQDINLFYRLVIENLPELMPLIYTPVIGEVCLQYSQLNTWPEALHISLTQRSNIRTLLQNWPYPKPEICVVTDGSRILGLGDLGFNGVGIPIGKLALYTAAAGIHPSKTLPIILDSGTNNEEYLEDSLYLGLQQKRLPKETELEFMDQFMEAAKEVYPDMLVQFEDFESTKAFAYLDRYRSTHTCFNDDIQGTGAVILAGYISASRISGVPIAEQRLVFMGAGSASVGVAKQLIEYFVRQGLSESQALEKFWLVDTKGLITKDRGDRLAEHKKLFARTDTQGFQYKSLQEVIEYVQPTALIGLSGTPRVFTQPVVTSLKKATQRRRSSYRPIIFALSNPSSKAECTFEQAVEWTEGSVIFASGSPFPSFDSSVGGSHQTYLHNQGNNVYVFPGLGLGTVLSKAAQVTDNMIYASAQALADSLRPEEIQKDLIYPRVERIRGVTMVIAAAVMKAALHDGVSRVEKAQWEEWQRREDHGLMLHIKRCMYDPRSSPSSGNLENKELTGKL